jgi:hypothetical protein
VLVLLLLLVGDDNEDDDDGSFDDSVDGVDVDVDDSKKSGCGVVLVLLRRVFVPPASRGGEGTKAASTE